jgi:hypothetical protein
MPRRDSTLRAALVNGMLDPRAVSGQLSFSPRIF